MHASKRMSRRHMLALLPLFASIEDRRAALDSAGGLPANLAEISTRIARWLDAGGQDREEADSLRATLAGMQPALDADAGWNAIMAAGLATRLGNLIDITLLSVVFFTWMNRMEVRQQMLEREYP